MGEKAWVLLYGDGSRRAAPTHDPDAARAVVDRLYPTHAVVAAEASTLGAAKAPQRTIVSVGCYPGLSVVCAFDAAGEYPSRLDERFVADGQYTARYATHAVDGVSFAVWEAPGRLLRALSVSSARGVIEEVGFPLPFERPFWDGAQEGGLPFEIADFSRAVFEGLLDTVWGERPAGVDWTALPVSGFRVAQQRAELRGFFAGRCDFVGR